MQMVLLQVDVASFPTEQPFSMQVASPFQSIDKCNKSFMMIIANIMSTIPYLSSPTKSTYSSYVGLQEARRSLHKLAKESSNSTAV